MKEVLNPARIIEVSMGFLASKTMLTAIKLELFTELGSNAFTGEQLQSKMGFHERGTWDFLDTLLSLHFLEREGNGKEALYSNTAETALFLDKNSPHYIGGTFEMLNDRTYLHWGDLEDGLKTGQPQSEIKHTGENFFEKLYASPQALRQFMGAMTGLQMGSFMALAHLFDFSKYDSVCDIGGASGMFSIQTALNHADIHCITFDLPPVAPIAKENIDRFALSSRIDIVSGDFFAQDFPKADLYIMGNILHDWDLEQKKFLIRKAYDALPANGALIIVEDVIDDERRHNTFGLLMSLHMLIEGGDAFNFTAADFTGWATEAGFSEVATLPLSPTASALIAFKK